MRDNKHIKHRILEPRILTKFHKVARGNQIVKSVVDVDKMNDGVQQDAFLNNDPMGMLKVAAGAPNIPFVTPDPVSVALDVAGVVEAVNGKKK